jgi:hypothetical protein
MLCIEHVTQICVLAEAKPVVAFQIKEATRGANLMENEEPVLLWRRESATTTYKEQGDPQGPLHIGDRQNARRAESTIPANSKESSEEGVP